MVRRWAQAFQLRSRAEHFQIPEDDLYRLAGLCAYHGGMLDSDEGKRIYRTIWPALFSSRSHRDRGRPIPRLTAAIRALPLDDKFFRVVRGVETFRSVCSQSWRGPYKVDVVVTILTRIPDPEPYVRYLAEKSELPQAPGVYFHPNVLERARSELPGIFSTKLGTEGEQFWTNHGGRIRVISD